MLIAILNAFMLKTSDDNDTFLLKSSDKISYNLKTLVFHN